MCDCQPPVFFSRNVGQGYRAEVRRNYEEFEEAFNADMKWRDDWAAAQRADRKIERRKANKRQPRGEGNRIALRGEEEEADPELGRREEQVVELVEEKEQGEGSRASFTLQWVGRRHP